MTNTFPKFIHNLAAQINTSAQVALCDAQRADLQMLLPHVPQVNSEIFLISITFI